VEGSFPLEGKDVSDGVSSFLLEHGEVFGIRPDELRISSMRESLIGWHVRFDQRVAGRRVHGTEVAVHVRRAPDGMRVFLVRSEVAPRLTPAAPSGSDAQASDLALELAATLGLHHGTVDGLEQVVLQDGRSARSIEVRGARPARLLRLVVADDGSLADTQELLKHADGTGWVFEPSPVASTGDFTLSDQANADSAALTAARTQVTLLGLDGSGKLSGPYVNAYNSLTSRAVVPSLAFDYTRSNDFFEEVMAYHHIDRAARRLHSLGFTQVMNWPISVQVNGKQQDNSWYDTKKNMIMFGTGGVDDAEDADVILHEYGHVILWDQVPGFGAGYQAGAIDEGFGDFHAVMAHSLGPAIKSDPACVAPWDATSYSPPPCLRRTDTNKHFPEFFENDIHHDGEMWSSALFEASATMGPLETLRLVVEANFLLSPTATFQQASDAVRQTETAIHAGANSELLRRLFTWRGLSRTLTPAYSAAATWESHATSVASPHPYSNLHDKWFDIHHAGATAIRVHFAQFAVEQGYDNVYLYDADTHLYAIYSGALGAFTSVAIPGATVRVRLVSDSQVTDSGYVIDSYEIPANNVVDAGAPDSAMPDVVMPPDAPADSQDASEPETGPDAAIGEDAAGEDAEAQDANEDAPALDAAPGDVVVPEDAPAQDAPADVLQQDSAAKDAATEDALSKDAAAGGAAGSAPEAGVGGAAHKDAGSDAGKDGSAQIEEESSGDSGGCGCRVAGSEPGTPRAISALALLGLVLVSRRRRDEARRAVLG